jgi:hypothetical protein
MMVPEFHGFWNWLAWLLIAATLSPTINKYFTNGSGKR